MYKYLAVLFKIGLICTLISPQEAWSCMAARQNRLFPLGKSLSGYVFLEVHLSRSGMEMVEWNGDAFLVVYNENHEKLHNELVGKITSAKKTYIEPLKQFFNQALEKAKTFPGFIAAVPKQLIFCDYGKTCSLAHLYSGKEPKTPYVEINPSKKRYLVTVLNDDSSIASKFIERYGSDDSQSLPESVLISSVRQVLIAGKSMMILHLGNGQFFTSASTGKTYPAGKEIVPDIKFDTLTDSVFFEPVIHHGIGFDFFIVE